MVAVFCGEDALCSGMKVVCCGEEAMYCGEKALGSKLCAIRGGCD